MREWYTTALTVGLLLITSCGGARISNRPQATPAPPFLTTLPPVTNTEAPSSPSLPSLTKGDICATFAQPEGVGTLASDALRETSGLVASRTYDGVLWAHNDSGDAAAVHAIGTDGSDLGRFTLAAATALDWEDIAIGPGPDLDRDYLYLGDIGDNLRIRNRLQIYRILEPTPNQAGGTIENFDVIHITFGGLGPFNAEAMTIDPFRADFYIITKGDDEGSIVFQIPLAELVPNETASMKAVAVLHLGNEAEVTAADISVDGGLVALRGYSQVWIWVRTSESAADVFAETPCHAPSPNEIQGEALAFDPTGQAYYTVSEGSSATVNFVGQDS